MARIIGTTGSAPPAPRPRKRKQPSRPYSPPQTPDSRDNNRLARHPNVSHVSPDAQDVTARSPQQRARDQAASFRNIQTARLAYLRQQRSQDTTRYVNLKGQPLRVVHGRVAPGQNVPQLHYRKASAPLAPGLSILSNLARPLHGIANEAKYQVQHGGVGELFSTRPGSFNRRALVRGLQNKDQTTFSDVLGAAGVKSKALRGIAGFALDVGLDPTTYVAPGISEGARAASKIPGAAGAAEAARGTLPVRLARHVNPNIRPAGVSPEDWATVREAMRRSRAVAATGEHRARNVAQAIARKLPGNHHPQITDALENAGAPALTTEERAQKIADLKRIAEGASGNAARQERSGRFAFGHANAVHMEKVAKDAQRQIDALERGGGLQRRTLSPDERQVVSVLQREYDAIHAAENAKGLVGAKFSEFGYSPRRPLSELEREGSRRRMSGAQLASSKARTNRLPYAQFRGTEKDIYTENAPLAYYLRARDSAVKLGRHEIIDSLHRVGRVFHPGADIKPGEDIYKFAPRKMPTKVESDELKSLMAGGAPAGRNEYRILSNDLVRAAGQSAPQRLEGLEELGRLWDRSVQGRIKTILTVPNPQYHLTNLYGDLFNAWEGSNVASLARNLGISARALTYKARREAAAKTLGKQVVASGTVKIRGRVVDLGELVKEAEDHGAIGQGFIGRDLADVLDAQGKEAAEKLGQGKVTKRLGEPGRRIATSRVGSKVIHPIDTIRDVGQYREDAVRLATYLGARKRGLDPDKAAAWVARHHFDYADLTQFERSVLRRVLPFYTFTARNTPLQIRTLLSNPGKFANLEKVREEARKASNVPAGYEKNLRLFEQQGLPIPVPGTGQLLYPKLPATDLSRLTVKDQGNYLLQMLSPIIKSPLELSQNYSFFFRQPIDDLLNSPGPGGQTARTLKPAPAWLIHGIQKIPGGAGEKILQDLHIRQYTDKTSGKRVWGWPAKLDYLVKQTPATSTAFQLGTGLSTSRGQTSGQKVLGYLSGLKVAPYSTPQINQQRAQANYNFLQAKAKEMRHNGDAYAKDGSRTAAYQRVLNQTRALEKKLGFGASGRAGSTAGFSPAAAAALSALPQGGSQFSPAAQAALDALGSR